jgi:hypothetical protein
MHTTSNIKIEETNISKTFGGLWTGIT